MFYIAAKFSRCSFFPPTHRANHAREDPVLSDKLKILGVVGARPNFMKIAPLAERLRAERDWCGFTLVHTGQHYDRRMNEVFFAELGIDPPEVFLGVGSGSHASQTARIMLALEPVLLEQAPHLVLVVGDVNSTVAGALVAAKLGIAVAHVEAGLRSFDRRMPEELNRILTDSLSELLFTPSRLADANLRREGVPPERICLVGNIMIDTLVRRLEQARALRPWEGLDLTEGGYGLVTLHRPANVDDPAVLAELVGALAELSRELPLVFPVHPRTRAALEREGLLTALEAAAGMRLAGPLGYLEFLALMRGSRLVLSDSGGIQEESSYLGIPCLTLRENTERPETIAQGTNRLVGRDRGRILAGARQALRDGGSRGGELEFWDGRVTGRIVEELRRRMGYFLTPAERRLDPERAR